MCQDQINSVKELKTNKTKYIEIKKIFVIIWLELKGKAYFYTFNLDIFM